MIVTKTEACTKTKYKVYLDGAFAFVLYKGEMSRFGITEGEDIPEETVEKIRTEVILKRAKLRAMHLLEDMDRTEAELREKLRQGRYPEEAVEGAVAYVRSFGYLDDARYAENFVVSRKASKSRREIRMLLSRKGIEDKWIERAFEICYENEDEQEAVLRILRKKKVANFVKFYQVSDDELNFLYQNALFFIFPSLYEGFGMPILEAMSNSCPVVLSNASCFPEIAQDAGLYFDPKDIEDMYDKMSLMVESEELRINLIAKGNERVKDFSWEKCANQHI